MGENHFGEWPVILYGFVLMMAVLAYYILAHCLFSIIHEKDSTLVKAIGKDKKGILSVVLYVISIGLSWLNPWFGFSIYIIVAFCWIIPEKRIENKVNNEHHLS